jgi:hypothetical protein
VNAIAHLKFTNFTDAIPPNAPVPLTSFSHLIKIKKKNLTHKNMKKKGTFGGKVLVGLAPFKRALSCPILKF